MSEAPKKDIPQGKPDLRPDGWQRFEKAVDVAVKPRVHRKQKAKDQSLSGEQIGEDDGKR